MVHTNDRSKPPFQIEYTQRKPLEFYIPEMLIRDPKFYESKQVMFKPDEDFNQNSEEEMDDFNRHSYHTKAQP